MPEVRILYSDRICNLNVNSISYAYGKKHVDGRQSESLSFHYLLSKPISAFLSDPILDSITHLPLIISRPYAPPTRPKYKHSVMALPPRRQCCVSKVKQAYFLYERHTFQDSDWLQSMSLAARPCNATSAIYIQIFWPTVIKSLPPPRRCTQSIILQLLISCYGISLLTIFL